MTEKLEIVGLTDKLLLDAKVGEKLTTEFGKTAAVLHCVEASHTPTIFVRFLVMVFGVEAGEVSIEQQQDGKIVREVLS